MNGDLSLARVLRVHPKSNTVDVMRLDTGAEERDVAVLSGVPSAQNTGLADLAEPSKVDMDAGAPMTGERDVLAVLAELGEATFILGFFYPQVSQLLFDREEFRVNRHASDWYTTVNKDGDFEAYHPSGSYVRIAEDPEHEDLTGQDFDGEWKIERNTDKKPHLRVVVANGGEKKLDIHADPDGNVTLEVQGKLDATVKKDVTLTAKAKLSAKVAGDVKVETHGKATVKSPSNVTVDAPTAHFTGDVKADGEVSAMKDTVKLSTHKHTGVTSGEEVGGPPVPE
jgi:phage gp45-like